MRTLPAILSTLPGIPAALRLAASYDEVTTDELRQVARALQAARTELLSVIETYEDAGAPARLSPRPNGSGGHAA